MKFNIMSDTDQGKNEEALGPVIPLPTLWMPIPF